MIKQCVICGKEFDTVNMNNSNTKTCSEKCSRENKNRTARQSYAKCRGKRKTKVNKSIVKINRKALALGMSYGQYVALHSNGGVTNG